MTNLRRFSHGDRIRYETTGDDGYPLVRYGFVGGVTDDEGPVVIMLDGELGGDVVEIAHLQPVSICNVVLKLEGTDLLDDPGLRQGLVNLWRAEAEEAGLQIASLHPIGSGTGVRDSSEGYALAELSTGGEQYVLRATGCPHDAGSVLVRCDRPNRWDF
ncbi:hypothetical protein [Ilumatobacter sp.]|uniref:hypothetical protein n=1 Tax=Ilumatobacter sp. TaxID=1967498 RepID=UPI003B52315E